MRVFMKKIISTVVFLVVALFCVTSTFATEPKFNTDSSDRTVSVTNVTQGGGCSTGPKSGCWKSSVDAEPGDIIAVQVYFHNSTQYVARDTTVGMGPKNSSASTSVTFSGEVMSPSIDPAYGSATVHISSAQSINFIPGSVRIFENNQQVGYSTSNEASLFSSEGFLIGDVDTGLQFQGGVVAQFQVSGNSDNGNDECTINSFTADDYNINEGDDTDLNWSTTGCDYVNISSSEENFSNRPEDGSVSVSPSDTTTYTLRAYPGGDSRSLTIYVDSNNNNTCSVDDFYVSPTSISRGQTATLHWSTSGDIDYVNIYPGLGTRSDDGSASVSPYDTTTYTLTVYCNNGDRDTDTATLYVNGGQTGTQPQAITTVATVLSSTSARLNGIAIPNTNYGTTYAWFEWGPYASFGYNTAKQTIATNTSTYYSDVLQSLVPGGTYYYRAVVQNQYGIAYGSPVRFQTTGAVASTTTVVKYVPQTVSTAVVAKSAPSLLELKVESAYDHMCAAGEVEYTITYRNLSTTQTLQNAVLRVALPPEMDYLAGTGGSYSVVDKTLTVPLANVPPAAQGTVQMRARVNSAAVPGNLAVVTATVVYTNTVSHAQEDAIAYSLVTITNECPNLLGASVFGLSFLPHTLLGWLLLILVILALIVLGRQMYKKAPTA